MNRLAFTLTLALAAGLAWADDGDYFLGVQDLPPGPLGNVAPPTEGPSFKIGGHTDLTAGALFGWKDGNQALTHGEGGTLVNDLLFDAKPHPALLVHGDFQVTYPSASSSLNLSSLYVDATLAPWAIVRLGKATSSWGSARVFNLIDLATDSSQGFSGRGDVLWTGGSLTYLATIPQGASTTDSQYALLSTPAWTNAVQAARANWYGSGFDAQVGWRHRNAGSTSLLVDTEYSAGWKLTGFGWDLFDDLLVQSPGTAQFSVTTVAGVFHEQGVADGPGIHWQFYSEYKFDRRIGRPADDHQAAAAVKWLECGLPSGQLGVQWLHSFLSGAGSIVAGYAWDAQEGLRVKVGVPVSYGAVAQLGYPTASGLDGYLLAWGLQVETVLDY